MEKLLIAPSTSEITYQTSEYVLNNEYVAHLGRLAIKAEYLGINDPLTHLYQYLEKGEDALLGIREDLATDIVERLPDTPFINSVSFDFIDDDFISVKDKVSMSSMTENNLQILKSEQTLNYDLSDELSRAEVEAQEPMKLVEWFKSASVGSYFVFESLPIGSQEIAVSRIYNKVSEDLLIGNFISLYNPSIEHINNLRGNMGLDNPAHLEELDVLMNPYEINYSEGDFIDYYVNQYDQVLQNNSDQIYRFGLRSNGIETQNGIDIVRQQSNLTSIYTEIITTLAETEGYVTNKLIEISSKIGLDLDLFIGQTITINLARSIIKESIVGIASVIDNASSPLLDDIRVAGSSASYAAISHFGGQARASGALYSSKSCPEYSRTGTLFNSDSNNDLNILSKAFNLFDNEDDFGRPKIDICRINNCPSRGNVEWYPSRTLVGGCSICVECHKIFKNGKSPEKIYNDKKIKNRKLN